MNIKIFKGDFFEIGSQQGKIYSKNRMSFKHINIDHRLFRNQLRVYKKYYPDLLEEFKGVALAGKFDENNLIYKFITEEILQFTNRFNLQKACTVFGVKSQKGIFVGRNYDWRPVTEKVFGVYKVVNPERNSFIALTDMGITGVSDAKPKYLFYNSDDAINDKGLFIGINFAYNYKWSYGLSCIHMTKLIAETCSTVGDAIKVFKTVPLCCPKNFFIADGDGDMAVVEHTSKKYKIIYPENNVLIKTNHYIDPELAKEDAVLIRKPTHNTFLRYYETLQKVNARGEKFLLPDVIKILGDAESCVCQNQHDVKTIWSLALDMKKRKYNLYWNTAEKRKKQILKL